MSAIAERERSQRQIWAAPGSRHDRVIAVARWLLPASIGVLAAFLVMAPVYSSGDVSFVLDKNKVEVAKERLKIQAAQYRGQDTKGQPDRHDLTIKRGKRLCAYKPSEWTPSRWAGRRMARGIQNSTWLSF